MIIDAFSRTFATWCQEENKLKNSSRRVENKRRWKITEDEKQQKRVMNFMVTETKE